MQASRNMQASREMQASRNMQASREMQASCNMHFLLRNTPRRAIAHHASIQRVTLHRLKSSVTNRFG